MEVITYCLTNNLPFVTQVIVTKEIPDVNRSWIKCLTKRGTVSNLDTIVANTPKLEDHNKSYADNVMDIFTSANIKLVKEQIKEPAMCNAVNELFADQIKEKDIIIANMGSQIAELQAKLDIYAQMYPEVLKEQQQKKSSQNHK